LKIGPLGTTGFRYRNRGGFRISEREFSHRRSQRGFKGFRCSPATLEYQAKLLSLRASCCCTHYAIKNILQYTIYRRKKTQTFS